MARFHPRLACRSVARLRGAGAEIRRAVVAPTLATRRAVQFRNQGLHRPNGTALDRIRTLTVYSTAPTSHLALIARVDGYRPADVEALVAERKVVRMGAMRGSGYLVPVELVPLVFGATEVRRERVTDLVMAFMDRKTYERIATKTEKLIAGTELSAAEIRKAIAPKDERVAEGVRHALRLMTTQCRLVVASVRGTWRSNLPRYRLWDEWLPDVDPHAMDPSEARVELARRYFEAHGPATVEDFRWWSGLGPVAAAVVAAAGVPELPDGYFGRAKRAPAPTGGRLLPIWDGVFLTHRDRTHVIADDSYGMVYDTSGNPTSVVLVDGRAAGVWTMVEDKKRLRIAAAPFGSFPARTWTAIESEAHRIAGSIGAPDVEIVRVKAAPSIAHAPRNFFMSPLRSAL